MMDYDALAAIASINQRRLEQIPSWTQTKLHKEEI